ncbi:MAG TPA: hypothetical protein VLL98_02810 [Rickettsiales bacterium]|nr:hypothetical protein [Rickettsiales bacterium]
MQDKPMLILTVLLTLLLFLYFWLFGFSTNNWTRYGQYGGLGVCVLLIIDNMFRD